MPAAPSPPPPVIASGHPSAQLSSQMQSKAVGEETSEETLLAQTQVATTCDCIWPSRPVVELLIFAGSRADRNMAGPDHSVGTSPADLFGSECTTAAEFDFRIRNFGTH